MAGDIGGVLGGGGWAVGGIAGGSGFPAGSVANYSDMRTALVSGVYQVGQFVFVGGRSSANDGGQGAGQIVATGSLSDDDAMVITGGSLAWVRDATMIRPEYCGNVDTSESTCSAALQAAIDLAETSNLPVLLGSREYLYDTTLLVDADGVAILGEGYAVLADAGADSDRSPAIAHHGSMLRYTGTGDALQVGKGTFGSGADFIKAFRLANVRIELDDDGDCGLHMWMPLGARVQHVTVFGNRAEHYGIRVRGAVDCDFDYVNVDGSGQNAPTSGWYASGGYLKFGVSCELGYANGAMTTTRFRSCYFHYCQWAMAGYYDFALIDSVLESSNVGLWLRGDGKATVQGCWIENIQTAALFSSISTYGGKLIVSDTRITRYAGATYLCDGAFSYLRLKDCDWQAAEASPTLFAPGAAVLDSTATAQVVIDGARLPANCLIGGDGSADPRRITIAGGTTVTYKHRANSVTGTTAISYMTPVDSVHPQGHVMPADGYVIGMRWWSAQTLSSGDVSANLNKNGSPVSQFAYPAMPYAAPGLTDPVDKYVLPLAVPVSEGDVLSIYFAPNNPSPSSDMIVEYDVVFGTPRVGGY